MTDHLYDFRVVDKWLIALGEHILVRYSLQDWTTGDELSLPHLKYHKVLPVLEIRSFDDGDEMQAKADLCARGIEAWMKAQQPAATIFQIDRAAAPTGRITVRMGDWGLALYYLRPLDRKRRGQEEARAGAARG